MSSKLSVGIHLLAVLALRRGEPLTSGFLARSANTNPVVVRRLLARFREAGYVGSKTGAGGGWVLRADPAGITLWDVLKLVETECKLFAPHRHGPNPLCPVGCNIEVVLADVYAEAQQAMASRLARSTIAGVVERLRLPADA